MNSGYSSEAKTNSQANKLSDEARKSNSITHASKVKYSIRNLNLDLWNCRIELLLGCSLGPTADVTSPVEIIIPSSNPNSFYYKKMLQMHQVIQNMINQILRHKNQINFLQ